MKLAIFGDIHGNAEALRAVLSDMESIGVDYRVCLGDIAFRGPQPAACLEIAFGAGLDAIVVGNTDQWLVHGFPAGFAPPPEKRVRLEAFRDWTLAQIDGSWLRRLGSLPLSHTVRLGPHTVTVVHSSPRSTEAWFDAGASDADLVGIFDGAPACDVLVYGHIHTPFVRRINRRWLVNTGSTGNPVDGDHRACYALLTAEGERLAIEIRRVPYDAAAVGELAQRLRFPYAVEYAAALRAGQAV